MSGLAIRHEAPMALDVANELPAIFNLASALIKAGGFLPTHLKVEGEIVAVVLAGRELGLTPMVSIRSIKLVKGNVTLDAALQLALMIRAGVKYKWLADGRDCKEASLWLQRPGQEPHVSTFSMADAERAGLIKDGGNWKAYVPNMLRARAISAAGKAYCPDILAGVYTPEEMVSVGLDSNPSQEQLDREAEAAEAEWIETREAFNQPAFNQPRAEVAQANPTPSSAPAAPTTSPSSAAPAPTPSKAERLKDLLEVRIWNAASLDSFVALAKELIELHGQPRNSKGWQIFEKACADREVPPREAIGLATGTIERKQAEVAQ